MAKSVASRWVHDTANGEYRFTIFGFPTAGDAKRFGSILRSWRDGKLHVASLVKNAESRWIADLGIRENGDSIEVWASDLEGLRKLASWADERGYETSFIW